MARLLVALVAALACSAEAFSFAPASSVVRQQSTVAMSTQFTDPYVQKMKKKNPMTGSTKNLRGYTVRAPDVPTFRDEREAARRGARGCP